MDAAGCWAGCGGAAFAAGAASAAVGAATFPKPGKTGTATGAAAAGGADSFFDMVRPGIALYGLVPENAGAEWRKTLQPVLSWTTAAVFLKTVKEGTRISYGGTWRAPRDSVKGYNLYRSSTGIKGTWDKGG